MKPVIVLNADARTDTNRLELLETLKIEQADCELWFYTAQENLDEFQQALESTWERAQLWLHTSIFADDIKLLKWLQALHPSWFNQTQLIFFSGGGLKDWPAQELQEWLKNRQLAYEIFRPAFPTNYGETGYFQLQHLIYLHKNGLDLRQRIQAAEELIEALAFTGITPELHQHFEKLQGLYAPARQATLQTLWQQYINQNQPIQALRDALFSSEA